jgi:hypothetical protein
MSTNHLAHSRARLAEASELADAGSTALARIRLLAAADHALIALAAHRAVDVSPGQPELDRLAIALQLAELGAAPDDTAPVLRDLNDDSADLMQDPALTTRLTAGFGLVHALIDASVAHTASLAPHEPAARLPLFGGANGALNARGAEAAARVLTRLATTGRAALKR